MTIKGYFTIFVIVLMLALVCAVLWLWRLKDNSQANLIAAQATIGAQKVQITDDQNTIKLISALRSQDDTLMLKFDSDLIALSNRFNAVDTNIQKLRRTNADVDKYLALPIPAALLPILNGLLLGQAASDATAASPK
jgi:hypothetical protein